MPGLLIDRDAVHSDVAAAQEAGLGGILVPTGKYRPADLTQDIRPAATLVSIADLPDWWHRA